VPTSALTCATSSALIEPLAFTSSRKFEPLTGCPACDFVWLTSEALTMGATDASRHSLSAK
jgi:hypothetical protein